MKRTVGIVGLGSVAFFGLAVSAVSDAGAEAPQMQELYTATRGGSPSPKYNLPPPPALPAGCTAPTKEQCADSTYYTSDACAKDPAKSKQMQDYCTWVLQKAWADTQQSQHQTLFPTSPPSSVSPILTPGRLDQFGKSVPAVKMNRPTEKRRIAGGSRQGAPRPAAPAATLNSPPPTIRTGAAIPAAPPTAATRPPPEPK